MKDTDLDQTEEEVFYVELDQTEFRTGDEVRGKVYWVFPEPPDEVEVRLLLKICGNRKTENLYAAGLRWTNIPAKGVCNFSLALPEAPYSFNGTHIHCWWFVEAQCLSCDASDEVEFSFSPTGLPLEFKKD